MATLNTFHRPEKGLTTSLAERVDGALRQCPQLCGWMVTCEEDAGTIVLQGMVPSYYLKQTAQTVAAGVKGVQRVVNDLSVNSTY